MELESACKATLWVICGAFDTFVRGMPVCTNSTCHTEILAKTGYGWIYIFLRSDVVLYVLPTKIHAHDRDCTRCTNDSISTCIVVS